MSSNSLRLSSKTLAVIALLTPVWLWAATGRSPHKGNQWVLLQDIQGSEPSRHISPDPVSGDWIAEADIVSAGEPAEAAFIFAIQQEHQTHLALNIHIDRTELTRYTPVGAMSLAVYPGVGPPPWRTKVRRRGAYYFFEVNGIYLGFTFHPSGDLDSSSITPSVVEPEVARMGVHFPSSGGHELRKLWVSTISFGKRTGTPVITPGPPASWNQAEAFPGAVIEYRGTYYLYLNGTDWTSKALEGGGHTRVGMATSQDMIRWKVDSGGTILGLGPKGSWDSTLVMVNGATRTAEGKFAVTYMGFDGKKWSGIGLATADHPAGPFTKWAGNPVLTTVNNSWETVIHEHTLYHDKDKYILFYTGFDGKNGDRGGLAYSRDLIHWTKDPSNPVFVPEGPSRWDSLHIRPRTLFQHGEYFYLFYEGAGMRPKFSKNEGGVEVEGTLVFDSVGLARSKDLHYWERFPWNPAIAQTGEKSFDALWTGWPHAVPLGESVIVLYAASDAWGFARKQGRVYTGLVRFDVQELENWGRSTSTNGK